MPATKLTSKGQITIPKTVREKLGLKTGDEIDFVEDQNGFRVRKRLFSSPFEKWRGFLVHLAGQDSDSLVKEMRGE